MSSRPSQRHTPCFYGSIHSASGSMGAEGHQLNEEKSLGITAYHIQNVLKAYHRRLRAKRMDDSQGPRGAAEGLVGMGMSTRQEIERQVASQIRQRLILRTFKE